MTPENIKEILTEDKIENFKKSLKFLKVEVEKSINSWNKKRETILRDQYYKILNNKIKLESKLGLSKLKKNKDSTNNISDLFKNIWKSRKNIPYTEKIKELIKQRIKWPEWQKHAEVWIKNYLKLPEETKNNLWKLVELFDNINWKIIWWLGIKESKFESNSESWKWAKWIFQVKIYDDLKKHFNSTNKYKWAEEKFLSDLKSNNNFLKIYEKMPREALWIAFLSYLIKKYNWNLEKAFWYYNSWKDKYKEWWPETINYVYWEASVEKYWIIFENVKKYLTSL